MKTKSGINDWMHVPLGEVCQVGGVKVPKFKGVRPYYKTGAIGVLDFVKEPVMVGFNNRPSRANCMPPVGAVGFAKMKGTKKVVAISEELRGALFSTGFCFLTPGKNVTTEWLTYCVLADDFHSAKDEVSGTGIMGGVKDGDVRAMEIPLPPLREQKRIVAMLNKAFAAVDTAIANTELNIANARELFENEINSVFSESTSPLTLAEVCEFHRGLTYKKDDEVAVSGNAVLRANNITVETGEINFDEIRYIDDNVKVPDSKKVKPECLLVCTASGSKKHLGKVGYTGDGMDYAFGGFMGLLVPSNKAMAKYLFLLTRSGQYRKFINSLTDGININNLKWSQLAQFPIPFRPWRNKGALLRGWTNWPKRSKSWSPCTKRNWSCWRI